MRNLKRPLAAQPGPVFARSLREVCEECGGVPSVVRESLRFLSQSALTVPGLFSSEPDSRKLQLMRRLYDQGHEPLRVLSIREPVAIAGLLKLWLISLPEPLISCQHFDMLARINEREDRAHRLSGLQAVLRLMDRCTLQVLYPLMEFLHHYAINQREGGSGLAREVAPLLLRPGPRTTAGSAQAVVHTFITDYRSLFTVQQQVAHPAQPSATPAGPPGSPKRQAGEGLVRTAPVHQPTTPTSKPADAAMLTDGGDVFGYPSTLPPLKHVLVSPTKAPDAGAAESGDKASRRESSAAAGVSPRVESRESDPLMESLVSCLLSDTTEDVLFRANGEEGPAGAPAATAKPWSWKGGSPDTAVSMDIGWGSPPASGKALHARRRRSPERLAAVLAPAPFKTPQQHLEPPTAAAAATPSFAPAFPFQQGPPSIMVGAAGVQAQQSHQGLLAAALAEGNRKGGGHDPMHSHSPDSILQQPRSPAGGASGMALDSDSDEDGSGLSATQEVDMADVSSDGGSQERGGTGRLSNQQLLRHLAAASRSPPADPFGLDGVQLSMGHATLRSDAWAIGGPAPGAGWGPDVRHDTCAAAAFGSGLGSPMCKQQDCSGA